MILSAFDRLLDWVVGGEFVLMYPKAIRKKFKALKKAVRQNEIKKFGRGVRLLFDDDVDDAFEKMFRNVWPIAVKRRPDLGEAIRFALDSMPQLSDHYPHVPNVRHERERIVVHWQRWLTVSKVDGHLCRHHKSNPTVRLNGRDFVFAASKHALDRICERFPVNADLGFTMSYIMKKPEASETRDTVEIWDSHGGLSKRVCNACFGQTEGYEAMVAHAPIVYCGEFVLAKTILYGSYGSKHGECFESDTFNNLDDREWQKRIRKIHSVSPIARKKRNE